MREWMVYLIECMDGSFYTGITNNLDKRMKAHASGSGSKYVYSKGFKRVIATKKCLNKSTACKAECEVKKLTRGEKKNWFLKNY